MRTVLLASALLFAGTSANAVTLVAGSNPVSGTTVAAQPQLAGTVLADELQAFSIDDGAGGTYSGNIQSRVVRSADGTVDFYWRVLDTAYAPGPAGGQPLALSGFRIGNFAPVAGLNGDFRLDGLGDVGLSSIYVFSGTQKTFANFNFANPLDAGESSYFMFLDTRYRDYAKTGLMDVANVGQTRISATFATFAPTGGVPEPAAWAMLLAGFGLTGAAIRRRRMTPAYTLS